MSDETKRQDDELEDQGFIFEEANVKSQDVRFALYEAQTEASARKLDEKDTFDTFLKHIVWKRIRREVVKRNPGDPWWKIVLEIVIQIIQYILEFYTNHSRVEK